VAAHASPATDAAAPAHLLQALRHQQHEPHKKGPSVVTSNPSLLGLPKPSEATSSGGGERRGGSDGDAYDVIVCGGTLGLLPALALQQRGWRVAVVERRLAEGRTQEWNSSRAEMQVGGGVLRAKQRLCIAALADALVVWGAAASPMLAHINCALAPLVCSAAATSTYGRRL
jgi:hypothetical protein